MIEPELSLGRSLRMRRKLENLLLSMTVEFDVSERRKTMKTMKQVIKINKKEAEHIQDLLKLTGDEIYQKHGLKRDETICNTAVFPNGVEMDIKLVICEGESYPYTEAILYDNGVEVDFTEPCDEYIDEWELEDEMNDVKYIVVVEVEE